MSVDPILSSISKQFVSRMKEQHPKVGMHTKTAHKIALEFICGAAAAQAAMGPVPTDGPNLTMMAFLVSVNGAKELADFAEKT